MKIALEGSCEKSISAMRLMRLLRATNLTLFGVDFRCRVSLEPRPWFQIVCDTCCVSSGIVSEQRGRKWYLSEHMLDDEIFKTVYLACKVFTEHELMEGFTFDGDVVFNPHTPFHVLLEASQQEEFRS